MLDAAGGAAADAQVLDVGQVLDAAALDAAADAQVLDVGQVLDAAELDAAADAQVLDVGQVLDAAELDASPCAMPCVTRADCGLGASGECVQGRCFEQCRGDWCENDAPCVELGAGFDDVCDPCSLLP